MAGEQTIDSLSIKIDASAASASKGLEKLVGTLADLSNSLGSVDTVKITALSNSISKLGKVDLSGINKGDFRKLGNSVRTFANSVSNAKSISSNTISLMNAISRISKVGDTAEKSAHSLPTLAKAVYDFTSKMATAPTVNKNVMDLMSAITLLSSAGSKAGIVASSLPSLATNLNSLITTLSKAPAVSKNVIQLVNSLANLSSQGAKVKTATRGLGNAFSSLTKQTAASRKSFKSLASAIGTFYVKFFMLIRAIKLLWKAIESSMDYVETYNFFNVAVDKIGKEFSNSFANWGYESAEAYADSFQERLNELTTKMTGYEVGSSGELLTNGGIGLGLDPNQVMNFQAKIMSMTNAVGLIGETSTNASKALSMLSSDMSSLFNRDLETVMGHLTSAMSGQSRVMYQYGIDITNANLANYALQYGVTKTVSAMTQAEKMQLRLLAILDQSKVAWGDQANTINSVANQYRMFKQQISNLGRTIGNLFIPILQAVLPVVNALVISLTRLFNMLGFKIYGDNWLTGIMDGISGGAAADDSYFDDTEDVLDDVADGYDSATNAAKEYENTVLSIDQLHKLNGENNSATSSNGSGNDGAGGIVDLSDAIAGALADYESVWNQAFDNMENRVNKLVGAISEKVSWMAQNIKWGFDTAFQADTTQLEENINRLGGALVAIWGSNDVKTAVSQFGNQALQTLGSVIGMASSVSVSFSTGIVGGIASAIESLIIFNQTKISSIFDNMKNFLETIENLNGALSNIAKVFEGAAFQKVVEIIAKVMDVVFLQALDAITGFFMDLANFAFGPIIENADKIRNVLDKIFTVIGDLLSPLGDLMDTIAENSKKYEDSAFHKFMEQASSSAAEGLGKALDAIASALETLHKWITGEEEPAPWFIVLTSIAKGVGMAIATPFKLLYTAIKGIYDIIKGNVEIPKWLQVIITIGKGIGTAIALPFQAIAKAIEAIKKAIEAVQGFIDKLPEPVKKILGISDKNTSTTSGGFGGSGTTFNIGFSVENLKEKIQNKFNGANKWWKKNNELNEVKTPVEDTQKIVKKSLTDTSKWWKNNNTLSTISTPVANIKDITQKALNLAKNAWGSPSLKQVSTSVDSLKNHAQTRWNETTSYWGSPSLKQVSTSVDSLRNHAAGRWNEASDYWNSGGGAVLPTVKTAVDNLKGHAQDAWDACSKYWGNNPKLPSIKTAIEASLNIVGAKGNVCGTLKWAEFASGGFPQLGDLFVANEAGPEMVGRMGSRTAVANNDQITAGIAAAVQPAVYNGMMMAMASSQGSSGKVVEIPIYLDGNEIGRASLDYQKMINKRYSLTPSIV